MAKIKFTKGELKRQRDALKQFQRYLPTLLLKKQQLQREILSQDILCGEKRQAEVLKRHSVENWAGLLAEPEINLKPWITPGKVRTEARNVAGVDLPVFVGVDFPVTEYDLFLLPLWVDGAIEALRGLQALREEIKTIEKAVLILRQELRIATQRVNLFEKVKIPEAEEAIRLIKIYISDQMANAVGRSKIAKKKIEAAALEAVLA